MIWTKYLAKSQIDGENSLVFNTLTGAVDVLPTSFFFQNLENLPPDVIQQLKERGYLFNSIAEEENLIKEITGKLTNKFVSYVACLTFSCNLACTYCFEGNLTKRKDTLNQNMIKDILSAIKNLRRKQEKSGFILFGGEPLLKKNKHLVESLLSNLRDLSIPVSIITNGIELDYYKDLIAKNTDTIKIVQVTIDGGKEYNDKRRIYANGRGTFDRIMYNLDLISALNVKILVRVHLDQYNFNSIDNLAQFIISKGWHDLNNMYFELAILDTTFKKTHCNKLNQLNEQQLLEQFNEKLKRNPILSVLSVNQTKRFLGHLTDVLEQKESTYGPRPYYCESSYGGSFVFSPDGYIYPCVEAIGREDIRIGKFSPDFEVYDLYKQWSKRTVLDIDECRNCNIALVCGGGCAIKAVNEHGTTLKPFCDQAKEVVDAFMSKKAKELSKVRL